jgi:hypothetical protein
MHSVSPRTCHYEGFSMGDSQCLARTRSAQVNRSLPCLLLPSAFELYYVAFMRTVLLRYFVTQCNACVMQRDQTVLRGVFEVAIKHMPSFKVRRRHSSPRKIHMNLEPV